MIRLAVRNKFEEYDHILFSKILSFDILWMTDLLKNNNISSLKGEND